MHSVDQNILVTAENGSVTNSEGKAALSIEKLNHVATIRIPKTLVFERHGKSKKGTGKGKGKANAPKKDSAFAFDGKSMLDD